MARPHSTVEALIQYVLLDQSFVDDAKLALKTSKQAKSKTDMVSCLFQRLVKCIMNHCPPLLVSDIITKFRFLLEVRTLTILWMRLAKVLGSSREKPDDRSAVSNSSTIRSLTVLSLLSASARSFSTCTKVPQGAHS